MKVRIGISGAGMVARQGRVELLKYLENLESQGWDSVWFTDRMVGPSWVPDPLVMMGFVAAHSEKLKFGTSVLLMSMRNPVSTARALATIDYLAPGRLVAGVGIGSESPNEYSAMGAKKSERGDRLNQSIEIMRLLWAEDTVTYRGKYVNLEGVGIAPRPLKGGVPIWIGGSSPAALERTALLGDGWLPSQITPKEIKEYLPWIHERSDKFGRQIPEDHYGALLRCYIVEKGEIPFEKIRPYLLSRRSDVGLNELHLLGSPEQVASRLQEFIDAGATKFVFAPACGIEELSHQMELQAELIVKYFHAKYKE